jgi:site-specific DNA-cytosine methylase
MIDFEPAVVCVYHVEHKELRACDYGAPTIRKRLFLIARRDGRPIVWPEPTHGDPKSEAVKSGKRLPWRTAAEIIDWTLPCPSIFLTPEEAKPLGVKRPLADATMARIAKGVMRYVIDAKEPFIVTLNHKGAHFRGQGLGDPFKTVTSARDAHGLVMPIMTYGQQGGANRSAEDPHHTVTASTKDTNAIVAAHITKFNTGSTGSAKDEPAPTVTANSFIKRPGGCAPIGVVAATIVGCGGRAGQSRPRGADEPLQTATAKAESCLAAVHLTKFSENSTGHLPDEPLHTVMAGAPRHGVVAAFLAQHNGGTCPGAREAEAPRLDRHDDRRPTGRRLGRTGQPQRQRTPRQRDRGPASDRDGARNAFGRSPRLPRQILRQRERRRQPGRAAAHHPDPRPPGHGQRRALRDRGYRHAHAHAPRAVPRSGLPGQLPDRARPRWPGHDAIGLDPHVRRQRQPRHGPRPGRSQLHPGPEIRTRAPRRKPAAEPAPTVFAAE